MLNEGVIDDYREAFDRAPIGFLEPSGKLTVEDSETGKTYVAPYSETDESFSDRIERSKAAGRNLFFEEWPVYIDPTLVDPNIIL